MAGAAIAALLTVASLSSGAQTKRDAATTSRDFSGTWTYATMTPLERPREFATKETLSEEEAAAYERQTIERQSVTNNTAGPDWWDPGTRHLVNRRTSLIVDPANGRLPPLTPAAQQRAAARAQARRDRGIADSVEDLALNERCLLWSTAGPPMLPGVYNNNVQFIVTRDHVVILNEMIHDARIIATNGVPHGSLPRWQGDSIGHWEQDTLIVDTINFTEKTAFRGSTDRLHLVERFTRIDADTIAYQFTADDSSTWTQPWTAMFPLKKSSGAMYEYACHEGNARSIEGILRGARTLDVKHRRRPMRTLLCVIIAAAALNAADQPATAIYKTEAELFGALAAGAATPDMLTSPVSINDHHRINIVRRTKGTGAVAHEGATELHHIIEGSGTLVTGGTMVRPGAARGGVATIENGTSRRVTKGDIVLVPSGMPHWYKDLDGTITYLEVRWDEK